MRNPKELFVERLKEEWKFNYKVFKTSLDWTVWLYILVPTLLIGVYHYLNFWNGVYVIELSTIFMIIYSIIYVCSWTGTIRNFVDYGDQIFLRQQKAWLTTLSKMGIVYSLIVTAIKNIFLFLLIAPLLIVYLELSCLNVIILFLFVYVVNINQMYLKQFISLYFNGLRHNLVFLAIFIALFSGYGYIIFSVYTRVELLLIPIIILMGLFHRLHKRKLNINWSFSEDCIREHKQKSKYARYLLFVSPYFLAAETRKKKTKSSKPWLHKVSLSSEKEYKPVHTLIRLYLKIVLRNKTNVSAILKITSLFLLMIILTEDMIKVVIWIIFIMVIENYIKSILNVCEQNQFFKIYPLKDNIRNNVIQSTILYLSLPSILLTSFVTGYTLSSISLGIFLMLVGGLIGYIMVIISKFRVKSIGEM